jgi:hypothetical protein
LKVGRNVVVKNTHRTIVWKRSHLLGTYYRCEGKCPK